MMSKTYDVTVIGAGPAGTAVGRRLALAGCRVLIIERTQMDNQRFGESLAPSVQPLLRDLGVWQRFTALGPLCSLGVRSIWGQETAQLHSHLFNPYGCGWHVDRLAFDRMLAASAVEAGAEVRLGTVLTDCRVSETGEWILTVIDRETGKEDRRRDELCARILVDGSGRGAHLARRMQARPIPFDRLVGVAGLFEHDDMSTEGTILLETRPEGWWYTAPAGQGKTMAMLMTDSDLCSRGKFWAPASFAALMARAEETAKRHSGRNSIEPRVVSAISHRLGRKKHHGAWIAVGDAALSVDPISGSGVVRALRTAKAGSAAVLEFLEHGSESGIQDYEIERNIECRNFLLERVYYYGLERRWKDFPFWQRRLEALDRLGELIA